MGNNNQQPKHIEQKTCNSKHCQLHSSQSQNYNTNQFIPTQQLDPTITSYYQISDNLKGKDELELEETKETIYKYIVNYFCGNKDLIFTKTGNNRLNNKSYSIYYAKLDCLVCTEQRYLIAIVPYDMTINGNQEKLSNLKWESLQTALFSEDPEFKVKRIDEYGDHLIKLNIKPQNYTVNENEFTKSIIEIEERKDDKSVYIPKKYPVLTISLFTS